MSRAHEFSSDVAFTPAVKAIQSARGSRKSYARMEAQGGWETEVNEDLAGFIARQRSLFMATVNAEGQPYIQHRGGPPGFLRVIDRQTLGFADFRGNRQYITLGNLTENPKCHLFLMDYEQRARVKIWGEARVVTGDAALNESLMPADYEAKVEQAILIKVVAWDGNCPQHIPQRFEAEDVQRALAERDARIAALERQLEDLRSGAHRSP